MVHVLASSADLAQACACQVWQRNALALGERQSPAQCSECKAAPVVFTRKLSLILPSLLEWHSSSCGGVKTACTLMLLLSVSSAVRGVYMVISAMCVQGSLFALHGKTYA